MMVRVNGSPNIDFQQIISYGDARGVTLGSNTAHFWHFSGTTGQLARICILPVFAPSADVDLILHGPNGDVVATSIGGNPGQPRTITFPLPQSGLYSFYVGEASGQSLTYEVHLEQTVSCI
jgi:hypothetical protein